MAPELQIRSTDGKSETLQLGSEPVIVGRAQGNAICRPDDPNLSRKHLVIEPDGTDQGTWLVRDLGSKNGTLINGVRIVEPVRVRPGDKIGAGHLTIVFEPQAEAVTTGVVFVVDGDTDSPPSATVMTSLEGVFSSEGKLRPARPTTGPAAPPGAVASTTGPAARTSMVDHPAVKALMWAGGELATHRPLPELFQLVLDQSLSAVGADRGVLMTLEGNDLIPRAVRGEGFRISTTVRDRVLREKTSLLVRDTRLDEAFRNRESITGQNVRTMMAAPLQTEDRVIGLIYVDSPFFVRDLTPEDLALLTVMANVAATRIEHQRLAEVEATEKIMARDLAQAAEIQNGLLPKDAPSVTGLDLAGYNAPCRTVGGDYYQFFSRPDGRVTLVLGDVSGKGMPAALLMTNLHALIQVLAEEPDSVSTLMGRLDRNMAKNCPSNRFISLFFGILDPITGEMTYCNAGHNPPIIIRADGRTERIDGGGTVLGILPGLGYDEFTCRLDSGDLIGLYSDGVTEAVNSEHEEFGEERLAELLGKLRHETAGAIVEQVRQTLGEWTLGTPQGDDITLVVARRAT